MLKLWFSWAYVIIIRGQHATDRRPVGETGVQHAHTHRNSTHRRTRQRRDTSNSTVPRSTTECARVLRRWTESVTPAAPVIGWLPGGGAVIPRHQYLMSAAGGSVRSIRRVQCLFLFITLRRVRGHICTLYSALISYLH